MDRIEEIPGLPADVSDEDFRKAMKGSSGTPDIISAALSILMRIGKNNDQINRNRVTPTLWVQISFLPPDEAFKLMKLCKALDRFSNPNGKKQSELRADLDEALQKALRVTNIARVVAQSLSQVEWIWHTHSNFNHMAFKDLLGAFDSFRDNRLNLSDHVRRSALSVLLLPGSAISRAVSASRQDNLIDSSATVANLQAIATGQQLEDAAIRNIGGERGREVISEWRQHLRLPTDETVLRVFVDSPVDTLRNNGIEHVLGVTVAHWKMLLPADGDSPGTFANHRQEQIDPIQTIRVLIPAVITARSALRGLNHWDAANLHRLLQRCQNCAARDGEFQGNACEDARKLVEELKIASEALGAGVGRFTHLFTTWLELLDRALDWLEIQSGQLWDKLQEVSEGIKIGIEIAEKIADFSTAPAALPTEKELTEMLANPDKHPDLQRALACLAPEDLMTLQSMPPEARKVFVAESNLVYGELFKRVRNLVRRERKRARMNDLLRKHPVEDAALKVVKAQEAWMRMELDFGTVFSFNGFLQMPQLFESLLELQVVGQLNCQRLDEARIEALQLVKAEGEINAKASSVKPENLVSMGAGPTGLLLALHAAKGVLATGGKVQLLELRPPGSYERSQVVRLDARWVSMLRFHCGCFYEDRWVPLEEETQPYRGTTVPSQGFIEVAIRNAEVAMYEAVKKYVDAGLITFNAGFGRNGPTYNRAADSFQDEAGIVNDNGVTHVINSGGKGSMTLNVTDHADIIEQHGGFNCTPYEPYAVCCLSGAKTSYVMHKFNNIRFNTRLLNITVDNTRLLGDFTKALSVREIANIMNEQFFSQANESNPWYQLMKESLMGDEVLMDYTYRMLNEYVMGARQQNHVRKNLQARVFETGDVYYIGMEFSREYRKMQDDVLDHIKFSLNAQKDVAGQMARSMEDLFTRLFFFCALEVIRLSPNVLVAEARGKVPTYQLIDSPLTQRLDTLTQGDTFLMHLKDEVQKPVQEKDIVKTMHKLWSSKSPWKAFITDSASADAAESVQTMVQSYMDACDQCELETAVNVSITHVEEKVHDVKVELSRNFRQMKGSVSDRAVHNALSWFYTYCAVETVSRTNVLPIDLKSLEPTPKGRALQLIGKQAEADSAQEKSEVLSVLTEGDTFILKLDGGRHRRFELLEVHQLQKASHLIRDSKGKVMLVKGSSEVRKASDLARNYKNDEPSRVAIAQFPVAHFVNFRAMRERGCGGVFADMGDAQSSPHFMRYSGLTGAAINVMLFQNFMTAANDNGILERKQKYCKRVNWSNSEVVTRGIGAGYGEDGFLRPGFAFKNLVRYIVSKVDEHTNSPGNGKSGDLPMLTPREMLSDPWTKKFAAAFIPRGIENDEDFLQLLRGDRKAKDWASNAGGHLGTKCEEHFDLRLSIYVKHHLMMKDPDSEMPKELNQKSAKQIMQKLGLAADFEDFMQREQELKRMVRDTVLFIEDFAREEAKEGLRISTWAEFQTRPLDGFIQREGFQVNDAATGLINSAAVSASVSTITQTVSLLSTSIPGLGLLALPGIAVASKSAINAGRYKAINLQAQFDFIQNDLPKIESHLFSFISPTSQAIATGKDQNPVLAELEGLAKKTTNLAVYYGIDTATDGWKQFDASMQEVKKVIAARRPEEQDAEKKLNQLMDRVYRLLLIECEGQTYLQQQLYMFKAAIHEVRRMLTIHHDLNNDVHNEAEDLLKDFHKFGADFSKLLLESGAIGKSGFARWYKSSLINPVSTGRITAKCVELSGRLAEFHHKYGNLGIHLAGDVQNMNAVAIAIGEVHKADLLVAAAAASITGQSVNIGVQIATALLAMGQEASQMMSTVLQGFTIAGGALTIVPTTIAMCFIIRQEVFNTRLGNRIARRLKDDCSPDERAALESLAGLVRARRVVNTLRVSAGGVAIAGAALIIAGASGTPAVPIVAGTAAGLALVSVGAELYVRFGLEYTLGLHHARMIVQAFEPDIQRLYKNFLVDDREPTHEDKVYAWRMAADAFLRDFHFEQTLNAERTNQMRVAIEGGMRLPRSLVRFHLTALSDLKEGGKYNLPRPVNSHRFLSIGETYLYVVNFGGTLVAGRCFYKGHPKRIHLKSKYKFIDVESQDKLPLLTAEDIAKRAMLFDFKNPMTCTLNKKHLKLVDGAEADGLEFQDDETQESIQCVVVDGNSGSALAWPASFDPIAASMRLNDVADALEEINNESRASSSSSEMMEAEMDDVQKGLSVPSSETQVSAEP